MDEDVPDRSKFIAGGSYEWPEEVASIVRDSFVNKVDMIGLNRLDYLCGAVYASKARQFMQENNIKSEDICARS